MSRTPKLILTVLVVALVAPLVRAQPATTRPSPAAHPQLAALRKTIVEGKTKKVRHQALEAMLKLEPYDAEVVAAIAAVVDGPESEMAHRAYVTLAQAVERSPDAARWLMARIRDPKKREIALGFAEHHAVLYLPNAVALLGDPDPGLRVAGARLLEHAKAKGLPHLPKLRALGRDDPEEAVRWAANRAVERLRDLGHASSWGDPYKPGQEELAVFIVKDLVDELTDPKTPAKVRAEFAPRFAKFWPVLRHVTPRLIDVATKAADPADRRVAVDVLGRLGADAGADVMAALKVARRDADPTVRAAANAASDSIASATSGRAQNQKAVEARKAEAEAEAAALAAAGEAAERARPSTPAELALARTAASGPTPTARADALRALGITYRTADVTLRAARDPNAFVREAALAAVARRETVHRLLPQLDAADEAVRAVAAAAIFPAINDRALDPTRPEVAAAARKALPILLSQARTLPDGPTLDHVARGLRAFQEVQLGSWAPLPDLLPPLKDALVAMAADRSAGLRARALDIAVGDVKEAVAGRLIGDEVPETATAAVDWLVRDRRYAPIARALTDERPAARAAALAALGRFRLDENLRGDTDIYAPLTAALSHADKAVRLAALELLERGRVVSPVEPRLAMAADPDPEVRRAATSALTTPALFDARALNALVKLTADADPKVRDGATGALGGHGVGGVCRYATAAEAARVVDAVAAALADPDEQVRRAAAEVLGLLGAEAAPAREKLVAAREAIATGDKSYAARFDEQIALIDADQRAAAASVARVLKPLLGDDRLLWRGAAAALIQDPRGLPVRRVVEVLARPLDDPDPETFLVALAAVQGLHARPERYVHVGVPWRTFADADADRATPEQRKAAIAAIVKAGPAARVHSHALAKLVRDPNQDPGVRAAARAALMSLWVDRYRATK